MKPIWIGFNISQLTHMQQLFDLAVQKEGLRVAGVALELNEYIAKAIEEARTEPPDDVDDSDAA